MPARQMSPPGALLDRGLGTAAGSAQTAPAQHLLLQNWASNGACRRRLLVLCYPANISRIM